MVILFADVETISLSALISLAVSAFVTVGVNAYMNRGHFERMVYGQVQKVIEFGVTYPYLEDDDFCANWPNIPDETDPAKAKEKSQRYEFYCCHVFNTLQRTFKLCERDTRCMSDYIYPDELIVRHKKWWKHDPHNVGGYSYDFRVYVESVLNEHGVAQ